MVLEFLKRTKQVVCPFNVVAEGFFHDEPSKSYFKLMNLRISPETTILSEGNLDNDYNYRLYGLTRNFRDVQRIDYVDKDLEAIIDPLRFAKGVVLPLSTQIPVLSYVKTVCLKDGRIFTEKNISNSDNNYWESLPWVIDMSGQFFECFEAHQIYRNNIHKYEAYWEGISNLKWGSEERWKAVKESWDKVAESWRIF